MDGVGTSVVGRPRRLSADRRARPTYTLIWEEPDARCRLTQALAEIPGPDVDEELSELARDEELQVSLTAKAVLAMRGEL